MTSNNKIKYSVLDDSMASLNRSSQHIVNMTIVCNDTVDVANNIIDNLNTQRHKIISIKQKTEHIDTQLTQSNRVLNKITCSNKKQCILSFIIILIIIIIIILIIILKLH